MNNCRNYISIIIALMIGMLSFQTAIAEGEILVEFYYNEACGSCRNMRDNIIYPLMENYSNDSRVVFILKDWRSNDTYEEEKLSYNITLSAGIVINKEIVIKNYANITIENLGNIINEMLAEIENQTNNTNEGFSLIGSLKEHVYLTTFFIAIVCVLGALAVFAWRKERKKE